MTREKRLTAALKAILAEVSDCTGARHPWCSRCRIKHIATEALAKVKPE
jgi:hypothetical protein